MPRPRRSRRSALSTDTTLNLHDDISMVEPEFVETELPSTITEFALSLASLNGNHWRASGTAVVVAPHLAITAEACHRGPLAASGWE
jgi:hypothetical protein